MLDRSQVESEYIPNLHDIQCFQVTVDDVQKENKQLKEDKTLLNRTIVLENKMTALRQDVNKILSLQLINEKKLLIRSIAYNYIDCAVLYVFGNELFKSKRRILQTMDDIEEANKTVAETNNWEAFKIKYYNENYNDVLLAFTQGRLGVVCPVTLYDDDENLPVSKEELKSYVCNIYHSEKFTKIKRVGLMLIDSLDNVSRDLNHEAILL